MKTFLDKKFEYEHYSGKLALIKVKIGKYESSDYSHVKSIGVILANLKSDEVKLQEILSKLK